MAEKKKKAVVESGFSLGGLFRDLGEFIVNISKLAEKGVEIRGEIPPEGMWGVSYKVGKKGPVVRRFGTIPKAKPEAREPLVDVMDEDKQIRIVAELPGIAEKDIKTEVNGKRLTIRAKTGERRYKKEIRLPTEVKEKAKLTYRNGVLEVILKKISD